MPRLARAAVISDWLSVFDSSLSKYRNVLSNCSSCAGVRFVIFRDTIYMGRSVSFSSEKATTHTWLSMNAIFLVIL